MNKWKQTNNGTNMQQVPDKGWCSANTYVGLAPS